MSKVSVLSFENHRYLTLALLFLASIHCALCIFSDNISVVDLASYAHGLERTPYQYRVAMIPVLRFAERNVAFERLAAILETKREGGSFGKTCEALSAEKLVCLIFGVASMLTMVAMAVWFGRRRHPKIWWLSGVLLLVIFYVSYAGRTEANFWYPYDLPHFALFGAACLAIFEGWWIAFLALFLLDIPFRETGVFLLPAVLLLSRVRGELWKGLSVAALGFMAWVPFRIWVTRHYGQNPTELGIHKSQMFHTFVNPLHWPQTASALGFLLLPLILGRARLGRGERLFLWCALPGLLITLAFGVWFESRIFDEWALAAAVLLTSEMSSLLGEYRMSEQGKANLSV